MTTNVIGLGIVSFAIDRPPSAATHIVSLLEGASTGTVSAGDTDPDGDSITVTALTGGTVGTPKTGTYGSLTVNANDTYSYTANNTSAIDAAPTGSHPVDTFTYTASDGLGGTTTETVSFTIDRPPSAVNDAATVLAGAMVSKTTKATGVLGNDTDPDGDPLVVSIVAGSAGNVGTAIATTYGHIKLNSDGTYIYVADNAAAIAGAGGSHLHDIVSYAASDGQGGTGSAQLDITVNVQGSIFPNTRAIFWHDASGANLAWALNQSEQIVGGPNLPTTPTSWGIAGTGDFNNDGISDLLWRDASGANQVWNLDGGEHLATGASLPSTPTSWNVAGIGNLVGTALADIVWHNVSGQNVVWNIQNDQQVNGGSLPTTPAAWSITGIGNFLGNGIRDLLWHHTQTGQNLIWNLQGDAMLSGATLPTTPIEWTVAGIGVFGGNGQSDILWHNSSTGQNLIWVIQNDQLVNGVSLATTPTSWNVAGIGDFTGNGIDDILWHDASGANQIWNMLNFRVVGGVNLPTTPTSWNIAGVGLNSITSALSTGHNGDPALSQMVQAMAGFSPSGAHSGASPLTSPPSDASSSQLFASNLHLGGAH